MILKNVLFLFIIIIHSDFAIAQNEGKIDRKLKKLFTKGKYEKCQKKAYKLNRKYPKSSIPEFYISKVKLYNYSKKYLNERIRYSNLRSAVNYSSKLPYRFNDWKQTVQDSLRGYIYFLNDSAHTSLRCEKALAYYLKLYGDTLDIYDFYFVPIEKKHSLVLSDFNAKSDSLIWELIKFAEMQEGIKYTYAGEKPETGFDCSGFTKYIYAHIGIELPHNAQKQSEMEGENISLSKARVGDLIFFGSQGKQKHITQHAGIIYEVINNDIRVVHCVSGGVSVDGKDSSWEYYWKDRVLFVKRLPAFYDN